MTACRRPSGMRALAAIGLFLLTACGSDVPPSEEAIRVDGSWVLMSGRAAGGDLALIADWPITIRLEGTTFGGTLACNGYSGRLTVGNGRATVSEVGSSAMSCGERIDALEAAYFGALRGMDSIGVDGDELVIRGPEIELRFARLEEARVEDLVDTEWVLESLFVGDIAQPPAGEPATLVLHADGTFTGSTGCRTFSGTWLQDGHRVVTPTMRMHEIDCRPATLQAQDSHVVSVVGDGFVPSIADGMLTLLDPGSIGLVYRPAE